MKDIQVLNSEFCKKVEDNMKQMEKKSMFIKTSFNTKAEKVGEKYDNTFS